MFSIARASIKFNRILGSNKKSESKIKNLEVRTKTTMFQLVTYATFLSLTIQYFFYTLKEHDVKSASQKIASIITGFSFIFKHSLMLKKEEQTEKLIDDLDCLLLQADASSFAKRKILKMYKQHQEKIARSLILVLLLNFLIFVIFNTSDPETKSIFEYAYWYSYPYSTILKIMIAFSCGAACLVNLTQCFIYISIVSSLSASCELLAYDISKLENTFEENLEKKMLSCIQYHERLYRGFKSANNIFSGLNFSEYLSCSASNTFCILATKNVGATDFMVSLIYFLYFLFLLSQLYIYCHFGEELKRKSWMVLNSFYMIKWYDQPVKTQKTLLMFIAMAPEFTLAKNRVLALDLTMFLLSMKAFYSLYSVINAAK